MENPQPVIIHFFIYSGVIFSFTVSVFLPICLVVCLFDLSMISGEKSSRCDFVPTVLRYLAGCFLSFSFAFILKFDSFFDI